MKTDGFLIQIWTRNLQVGQPPRLNFDSLATAKLFYHIKQLLFLRTVDNDAAIRKFSIYAEFNT